VVEVKNNRIAFAAIHARVAEEIREQPTLVALAEQSLSLVDTRAAAIAIHSVIGDHLLDVAFAAVVLASVVSGSVTVKARQGLDRAAATASLARDATVDRLEEAVHRSPFGRPQGRQRGLRGLQRQCTTDVERMFDVRL